MVQSVHIYVQPPKVKGHVYVENNFCRVSSRWWSRGFHMIVTLTQLPRNARRDFVSNTFQKMQGSQDILRFHFWKSNYQMALIWKRAIFTYFLHVLITREKTQKIPSAHISLTYIPVLAQPIDSFCLTNLAKITHLSCMVPLWCYFWC